MSNETPVPLGLKKSFGFGDRLGLAGPGHLAAVQKSGFAPILAQQSIREMTRTNRTPEAVMRAAQQAIKDADYALPWGADADHLKSEGDVEWTAQAGFCFFTIDPSEHVENGADTMDQAALEAGVQRLIENQVFADERWESRYLGQTWDIADASLQFDRETLYRAAVKYGHAVAHCETMAGYIAKHNPDRLYEIEVSVDETDAPTSHLEHLFFALELRRRGVTVVSLAPRFIGEFEKGVDYRGDLAAFEASLQVHAAIAREMGPYKISIHSGSDKFSIYPAIGRICGELLHVKTAGTSYLEALRVVCRQQPELFQAIVAYAAERFPEDRASYHISVTNEWVAGLGASEAGEATFLDEDFGRQLLHVTFGSVLTKGSAPNGRPFKDAILECLETNASLHQELLERRLGKHLSLLNQG